MHQKLTVRANNPPPPQLRSKTFASVCGIFVGPVKHAHVGANESLPCSSHFWLCNDSRCTAVIADIFKTNGKCASNGNACVLLEEVRDTVFTVLRWLSHRSSHPISVLPLPSTGLSHFGSTHDIYLWDNCKVNTGELPECCSLSPKSGNINPVPD